MAPKNDASTKKVMNKGAWTAEEDRRLAQHIEINGAKRWKTVASKSGLNRCGKSCRLRWLNYLRPNIKRGNISDDEEDLILRLHKLLGNRWSLIAGRLPGRTDNEIKNYWNSHLSKKINQKEKIVETSTPNQDTSTKPEKTSDANDDVEADDVEANNGDGRETSSDTGAATTSKGTIGNSELGFDVNEFFDFTTEGSYGLDWVNKFLELDEDYSWLTSEKRKGEFV